MQIFRKNKMTVLKFSGGISYSGTTGGSRAQVWLIDSETILIDLISKPWVALQPDTHFVGVAKKRLDGKFVTPWVYLMNPQGGEHVEGSVQLSFHITHLDDEIIRIIGTWITGEDLTEWQFDNNIPRLRESGN